MRKFCIFPSRLGVVVGGFLLTGCVTAIPPSAANVRVISSLRADPDEKCQFIGPVSEFAYFHGTFGANTASAKNQAIATAAEMGGNAIAFVDIAETPSGSTVRAEVFYCERTASN